MQVTTLAGQEDDLIAVEQIDFPLERALGMTRPPKGPFQGKIDLFYRDEIVFLPSKRSDLHLLHDCFLEEPHARLRKTVESLTAASYASELVELATEREDPNARIYELLVMILDALERRCDAVLLIWFEIQLLAAAGWKPKWESETSVEPGAAIAGGKVVERDQTGAAEWRAGDRRSTGGVAVLGRAPRTQSPALEKFLEGTIHGSNR